VEIKRDLEQNGADAVRIMTVHGSKGLQAPVVILPDTVRVKNLGRDAKWFRDGELLLYPLNKEAYTNKCCEFVEKEKLLSLEEYHRLLYVALTRAEDRLCVCGYKKKSKPNEESWYEIFKEAFTKLNVSPKDDKTVYSVEQLVAVDKVECAEKEKEEYSLPKWFKEIPKDEGFLAKPLTPSHQEEKFVCAVSPLVENNDGKLFARGKLIHKMLQFLLLVEYLLMHQQLLFLHFLLVLLLLLFQHIT
jgi:ATP-dependent helicase/nuclease subunit A